MNNILTLSPPFIIKKASARGPAVFKSFLILVVLSMVFLSAFHIFQTVSITSQEYLIKKYERRLEEISLKNKSLEIAAIKKGSLDSVLSLLENRNFEKVDKIHYIKILDNQVVKR